MNINFRSTSKTKKDKSSFPLVHIGFPSPQFYVRRNQKLYLQLVVATLENMIFKRSNDKGLKESFHEQDNKCKKKRSSTMRERIMKLPNLDFLLAMDSPKNSDEVHVAKIQQSRSMPHQPQNNLFVGQDQISA